MSPPPECQLPGQGLSLINTAVSPASVKSLQMCTDLSEVDQFGDGNHPSSALELLTVDISFFYLSPILGSA